MERKWTLAKQLSKSCRFLAYIQSLEARATISCLDDKSSTNQEKNIVNLKTEIEFTKSTEINNTPAIQKSMEHCSFYDLKDAIDKSPFKPKEKSLNRNISTPETVLNHDFSKPLNTSEVFFSKNLKIIRK